MAETNGIMARILELERRMSEAERETRQLGVTQADVRNLSREVAKMDQNVKDGFIEMRGEFRHGLSEVQGEGKSTRRLLIGMLSSVLIALLITIATQYGGG